MADLTRVRLEGLTLMTGRQNEAGRILRMFAHRARWTDPNMFPEGEREGLYPTADATLWFFHAIYRCVQMTNDRSTRCGDFCAMQRGFSLF